MTSASRGGTSSGKGQLERRIFSEIERPRAVGKRARGYARDAGRSDRGHGCKRDAARDLQSRAWCREGGDALDGSPDRPEFKVVEHDHEATGFFRGRSRQYGFQLVRVFDLDVDRYARG